jgi:hypothetical protein
MASNKSPLGDGKSGANGNNPSPMRDMWAPAVQQNGSARNAATTSVGGPTLKLDPPNNRGGMIGTTADPNQRRPFRLGGTRVPPSDDGSERGPGIVGGVPGEDASEDDITE